MKHISASAYDIESVLARRVRPGGDGLAQVRAGAREEPRGWRPEQPMDADMLDVVQKFEQVYAQLGAIEGDREPEREMAERAAVAFRENPSSSNDTGAGFEATSFQPGATAVITQLDPTDEKFVLPELEVIARAGEPGAASRLTNALASKPRVLSPAMIASTCMALAIGAGTGYFIAPSRESPEPYAKIEPSRDGGTQLRVDYALPKP